MSRFVLISAMLLAGCGASAALLAQNAASAAPPAGSASRPSAPATVTPDEHNCIRETGSHIPARKGHCLPVNGRSYTREELQRTGEPELGRALQKLDPSITVRGH